VIRTDRVLHQASQLLKRSALTVVEDDRVLIARRILGLATSLRSKLVPTADRELDESVNKRSSRLELDGSHCPNRNLLLAFANARASQESLADNNDAVPSNRTVPLCPLTSMMSAMDEI
jgi:hypothetical protein